MRETDLYAPVKVHFEAMGFEVRSEVRGCDVVAQRGDELVLVELKTTANMKLLAQATARQELGGPVYVAIAEPNKKGAHYRGIVRVLKRLNLGLLLVRASPLGESVREILTPGNPGLQSTTRRKRERQAVVREASKRSGDYNAGGMTRVPVATVYRETAILIACHLEARGPLSPKTLRELGTGPQTAAILQRNYYGWFERISRGVYRVNDAGIDATSRWPELRARCLELVENDTTLDPT
ncbi:MAG: hypothetical protein KDI19_01970 [Pseudomonadales bacterium]|nr:hypothetical protein [Pseudomonadales bacterium]